jgi:hypothetical protein
MKALRISFLLMALLMTDARAAQLVPLVACPGFTQGEPDDFATSGATVSVPFSKKIADRVAVYASLEGSVLAPRGWKCSAMRGTGNGTLFVLPPAGSSASYKGASVLLGYNPADSSAIDEIAQFTIRYFPKLFPVVAESEMDSRGITKEELLGPPYPEDILRYKSNRLLEFLTPPDRRGLGTSVRREFGPSHLPTYGAVDVDLAHEPKGSTSILTVRLSPELSFLQHPILTYFESTFPR